MDMKLMSIMDTIKLDIKEPPDELYYAELSKIGENKSFKFMLL
jgi:pyruvate-formate lyase-activating enzyme